jgi:DNA-binding NarL/FixJ family response regulator
MLRDIVRALAADEPRLLVVAEVQRESDLASTVARFDADAVLTSAGQSDGDSIARLLRLHPQLRVLTYTADHRVGYLDRLVQQRTVLQDMSAEDLVQALLGQGRFS